MMIPEISGHEKRVMTAAALHQHHVASPSRPAMCDSQPLPADISLEVTVDLDPRGSICQQAHGCLGGAAKLGPSHSQVRGGWRWM